MPKPVARYASPKLIKTALFVVAAGILLFTGFLLLTNYRSQVRLRNTAVDRFKYRTEQRAVSLAFFFNERFDDLQNLTESRAVEVYFENQALGMSMVYGLRASLFAVHQKLQTLVEKRTHSGRPVYKFIMVVDAEGKAIASSDEMPHEAVGQTISGNTFKAKSHLHSLTLDQQAFIVSSPIYFKNRVVGWVVGRLDDHCLREFLVDINDGQASVSAAILASGRLYLDRPEDIRISDMQRDLLDGMPVGVIEHLELTPGQGGAKEHLALKVPLVDFPLALIGLISAEDVYGRTAPWHIPVALAAISAVLFCGLVFFWRQNTAKQVLQARLTEADKKKKEIEQKNQDLEFQIEKRRETENRLRESELRFRNLVESINDWFWEVDPDGVYTYVGPQIKTLLGYDPEEVLGKRAFDFMPLDERKRVMETFKTIAQDHKPIELLENTLVHKQGHQVVVQTSGLPIFDTHEKFLGYRGTDRDITEKLKLEERLRQVQKLESIGTLAGGIAHDFNNLLSVMIGNAELALDDVPEWNPSYRSIEEIISAGMRAVRIIKQLLNFSRKSQQELGPIEIIPVIRNTIELLRAMIPSSIEIRPDLPATCETVVADPIQINQVIMNLCINASQAMDNSKGVIEIRAEKVTQGEQTENERLQLPKGDYIKITISDTGPGIDPQIIDRIFDPYFTTKEVGKGSGMGLAVVHGIVKNHGGAIAVASEVGTGSTFTVFFPLPGANTETAPTILQNIQGQQKNPA
jgi:PAS domain S-box-containing protein